jgi:putative membrane protein
MNKMYGQNRRYPSRAWFLVPIIGVMAVIGIAVAAFFLYRPATVTAYPFYGWWFPFPWFFIIPAIFLLFFGLRWIFWGGWGWGGGWYYRSYNDPALEILKERFARGELTKEQFEQMAKDLEQH